MTTRPRSALSTLEEDEVEKLADALLRRFLDEERQTTPEKLANQARTTLQQFVTEARPARAPVNSTTVREAIRVIKRLLATTAVRPGLLAKALGYQENKNDAEHRAMMRAMEWLHNDPLPAGSVHGRAPRGRGHRLKWESDTCLLCGAEFSTEKGWRADCPHTPLHRIRSKGTCAEAVAVAAQKAGITNANGEAVDSDALLKMYRRWQRDGSPREREHDRLLRGTQK